MASESQRPYAPPSARSHGARATPLLQTDTTTNPNKRYSYMDTPVEMQRPVFQQFSSPTNSTIDESPISSVSTSKGLPIYSQGPHGGTMPHVTEEKVQLQPPQQVHPAYYAPYREEMPAQATHQAFGPEVPLPPDPTLPSMREEPTSSTSDFQAPPAQESAPGIGSREIYNPASLQGPNVGMDNHRPGQVSHPNSNVVPHWKHGLCEPDALCCMGVVCPCMVYGKTMYRLSRKAQKQDPTDMLGYESCSGSCGFMALACGFQCILAAIQRTRVRKLYKLEGSFASDCLTSICCCCCVLMQDEREVRDREDLIRNHAGPATGTYVAPGAMIYAPPPR